MTESANGAGLSVSPTSVLLGFIYLLAVWAVLPYYLQPVEATGQTTAHLIADGFSHMFGVSEYLWKHPLRALAVSPAVVHVLNLLLRPVRMYR